MVESFGSRLRQLREEKHCKQEQIARLSGMNKAAISAYENGIREPSMQIFDRLANICMCQWIILWEDNVIF